MNLTKQLGLVLLLICSLTLIASVRVQAGDKRGPFELTNVGDEPLATGQYTYWKWRTTLDDLGHTVYTCELSISCQNLTPGETYWTSAGIFTANAKGNGKVSGTVSGNWGGWGVEVGRLNPDGTLTTVLVGG